MDSSQNAATVDEREELRKRLRDKIDSRQSRRAKRRPGEKTKTKSQSVDDILQNLGVDPTSDDGKQVKEKLVADMRSGKVSSVAQLSEWLALNAPVSAGVDPSQALAVRQAASESMQLASSVTHRLAALGQSSGSSSSSSSRSSQK